MVLFAAKAARSPFVQVLVAVLTSLIIVGLGFALIWWGRQSVGEGFKGKLKGLSFFQF